MNIWRKTWSNVGLKVTWGQRMFHMNKCSQLWGYQLFEMMIWWVQCGSLLYNRPLVPEWARLLPPSPLPSQTPYVDTVQHPGELVSSWTDIQWHTCTQTNTHLSSELILVSKLMVYWKPEQPPPSTVTLNIRSGSSSVTFNICCWKELFSNQPKVHITGLWIKMNTLNFTTQHPNNRYFPNGRYLNAVFWKCESLACTHCLTILTLVVLEYNTATMVKSLQPRLSISQPTPG